MNMESNEKPIINRIKVVLVEQRRTNKWLADTLGKDCTTVSKWCTNTAQPGLVDKKYIVYLRYKK